MQKYLAIVIVIVCTVLLQAHSIPFWLDQTQSDIGYLWSLTIEGVALWLWLNKKLALATVASIIIILVPLMQLSKPLIEEIRVVNANTHISKLNTLELQQSKLLQDKYLQTNWAGTLSKNTQHFRDAINTQKELLLRSSTLRSTYENILIIILQSVALIVVLLTQIQALRMLEFRDFKRVETLNFGNSEITETTETRAKSLLIEFNKHMSIKSMSQLELAIKLGVSSSTISKLRNRATGQGEALSDKKLSELEDKFQEVDNVNKS